MSRASEVLGSRTFAIVHSHMIHVNLSARIALVACTASMLISVAQKRNEAYAIGNGFTVAALVRSRYARNNLASVLKRSRRAAAHELNLNILFAERGSPMKDARKLADELGLTRKVWFLSLWPACCSNRRWWE